MNKNVTVLICLCTLLLAACAQTQPVLQITLPDPGRSDTLLIYKDIPYNSTQALDVYQPISEGPHPLVLILHGGGAHKYNVTTLSVAVADLGAVVFTPEYHASAPFMPGEPVLLPVEEAACALRFARAVAGQFSADPGRVLVIGHSAGGFVAADLALAGNDFHGDCLVEKGSALPDAILGLDGAYDTVDCCIDSYRLEQVPPEEWDRLSPFSYVDRKPIRKELAFFLMHGLVPEFKDMSIDFADRLKTAGYTVTLEESPVADHFTITTPQAPGLMDLIQAALAWFQAGESPE